MAAALSNYSDPDSVPHDICDRIAEVLRNPFYRGAQFINCIESIGAVACIVYACCRCRKKLSLHPNIEILLCTLYVSCLLHATFYCVAKVYQLSISFFTSNQCHMFLPRNFYIITHVFIVFGNCGIRNTQTAMIIERCVATALVDTYEKRCRTLGVMLTSVVIIVTSMEVGFGFYIIAGNHLMTNSLMYPDSKSGNVTITFAIILVFSCCLLATTVSLFCFNLHRRRRRTLTSRYQSVENLSTSALLCIISIIQLVTFALYAFAMTYLRLMQNSNPLLDAYKEAGYLVPLTTFLIPFVTIVFIEYSKKRRRTGIDGMLKMKTNGQEGWENYAAVLKRHWK
ncbi:hypothetical protein Aduo_011074 [Ancylostoma duodenale]